MLDNQGSFGALDSFAGEAPNPMLSSLDQIGMQAALTPQDVHGWQMKQECLAYCQKFLIDSISWRRTSFEPNFYMYRRNADSIYDPQILMKKEAWQSRAFVGLTASHRENIQAAIYKMMVGVTPMLEMRPRNTVPNDQSGNIRDLILREIDKSDFKTQFNMVLDDATTFGSGFCRIRYATEFDTRFVRFPEYDALRITDPKSVQDSFEGTRKIKSFIGKPQRIQTYRGIKFEWLSIWDIFPDPKGLPVSGKLGNIPVAYRFKSTYGEVVEGVKRGYYFPEAVHLLRNAPSREIEPVDRSIVMADRTISPSYPHRTDYARKIQCHEFYSRLPKKWVYIHGEEIDDPEELVPARILMAGEPEGPLQCILAIEINDDYEGDCPIFKLDFMPVADRFYGRGISEMLEDYQEIINETVNQRNDNIALVLNRMFGIIERAIVDPADLVSKPGGIIKLDGKLVKNVNEAIMPIEFPDITTSAYKEVQELERYAQERTSANRVTLGTNGLVGDQNRTATGLEILRQSAGEKFAYVGMMMEFSYLSQIFRAFWKNLYANLQPDDIIDALGPERAKTFKLLTPEQIEKDYIYEPQGIFTMENRTLTAQRLQGIYSQFVQEPWLDQMAFFDKECKASSLDPDTLKLSLKDMQTKMTAQAHMSGAVAPPGAPPMPGGGPVGSGPAGAGPMGKGPVGGPMGGPPPGAQGPVAGPQGGEQKTKKIGDEQLMDEAMGRLAVKSGKVSPSEASRRMRLKYGDQS